MICLIYTCLHLTQPLDAVFLIIKTCWYNKSLTFLQEVQRLRMSGAFPARNYCVTPAGHSIKSVTFCPPSPKKSLQSPRKNTLPDGTNPYKTHVPVRFHSSIAELGKIDLMFFFFYIHELNNSDWDKVLQDYS